jgi:hypothetical protein
MEPLDAPDVRGDDRLVPVWLRSAALDSRAGRFFRSQDWTSLPIDVDSRHWPLIFTRFDGEQTMEQFEVYIAHMEFVHRRKQLWANVCFMNSYSLDRRIHERVAAWMKQTEAKTREFCIGVAMIAPTTGFRFVLSTVLLMKSMPCPYGVYGRFDDAMAFVRAEAVKRGVELPVAHSVWAEAG